MRVAVSGAHSTGKSSLIGAFVSRRPDYTSEPEAYELLADDVPVTTAHGPTLEGLEALLEHTVEVVGRYPPGARVVFERSPVDYLAYAASGRSAWGPEAVDAFLETHVPSVRAALRHLDLIVLLPVSDSGPVAARSDEDPDLRMRVDEALRRALVDDELGLFVDRAPPLVEELSPLPERQLAALIRHAAASAPTAGPVAP